MNDTAEHYILATGGRDIERLRLLHEVYGPGTQALFGRVGLRDEVRGGKRGTLRVVEIGCGSGNITCWVAEELGAGGSVVGIDRSPEQVEQAKRQAEARGLTNVEFQVADAYSPRLPEGSFDVAYCRLVLMHLAEPRRALEQMRRLVRPGGWVVCEEMDLGVWLCDPPSEAMSKFYELNHALGRQIGEHFRLGGSLHRLFRTAGFAKPQVHANFTMAVRGEEKRLLVMTFNEFAPELVRMGLATQAEVDEVSADMQAVADDETTLFAFPLVVQVWAEN